MQYQKGCDKKCLCELPSEKMVVSGRNRVLPILHQRGFLDFPVAPKSCIVEQSSRVTNGPDLHTFNSRKEVACRNEVSLVTQNEGSEGKRPICL